MTTPLTPGQKAQLTADLEQHERALRAQLEFHLHGQSRVDRAADAPAFGEAVAEGIAAFLGA